MVMLSHVALAVFATAFNVSVVAGMRACADPDSNTAGRDACRYR